MHTHTLSLPLSEQDPEERRGALPGLFAHVRMGLLPLDCVERMDIAYVILFLFQILPLDCPLGCWERMNIYVNLN